MNFCLKHGMLKLCGSLIVESEDFSSKKIELKNRLINPLNLSETGIFQREKP